MNTQLKHTKYNFNKVNGKLIALNVFLLVLFFLVQIVLTSQIGTKTQEIDLTRKDKNAVREESRFLESEIAKAKAIAATQDVVEKYNLIEKNVTFLEEARSEEGLAFNVE